MNSTTFNEIPCVGDEYYVPFWVLLEFLDTSPPDPFIKVEVISSDNRIASGPEGPVEIKCCDIMCDGKRQLIAHNIPAEYLIAPKDLHIWAIKIGDWFRDFSI